MGKNPHAEMLRQARMLRAKACWNEEDAPKALLAASDRGAHPDVLDILATREEHNGKPGLVPYKLYVDSIPMAIVRNPSTRLQTLERMKTVKDYRQYFPEVADAVLEELDARPSTPTSRIFSETRQMALAVMYWWMYGFGSGADRPAYGRARPKRKRPIVRGPWRDLT